MVSPTGPQRTASSAVLFRFLGFIVHLRETAGRERRNRQEITKTTFDTANLCPTLNLVNTGSIYCHLVVIKIREHVCPLPERPGWAVMMSLYAIKPKSLAEILWAGVAIATPDSKDLLIEFTNTASICRSTRRKLRLGGPRSKAWAFAAESVFQAPISS